MTTNKEKILKEFTKLLNKWSKFNKLDIKFVGSGNIEGFLSEAIDQAEQRGKDKIFRLWAKALTKSIERFQKQEINQRKGVNEKKNISC